MAVTISLLTALGVVATPTTAFAASTVLFDNPFKNNTVNGTGTVNKPPASSGTNVACLTASGNAATPPLPSCAGNIDSPGAGTLRLTAGAPQQVGGVVGATSFPTSSGLDVTFNSYQYGGGFGGEGIAFLLAAVDPANPQPPATIGTSGAGLGYSGSATVNGLTNAYLGVGLDVLGDFSNSANGTGCTNPATINGIVPEAVVVRGPGSGKVGYCGLASTYDGTSGSKLTMRRPQRGQSIVPVEVLINPTTLPFTSASGVTVAAGSYTVIVTGAGSVTRTLSGPLPAVPGGLYPSGTWLSTNGVPKQLVFGFVGSTGTKDDIHEVSDVKVLTFNPVPQLAVTTTSYSAATSGPGDPVTYKATARVLAGANETSPISVTQTVPVGVVPAGAYGTGWVCQAPAGQTITCTTSGSSFTNGTALPAITVVAIVTTANLTSTVIQTTSTTTAWSADAPSGTNTTMTAGTLPSAPAGVTLTPAIGPAGGTVTVSGTNIAAATAIEIGTTSEQQAGTPVVLLPCPGAAAPGCFTVSGSSLVISSMPARANTTTVSVTIVTSGVAAAAGYLYADKPATPATPIANAAITSATVTWVTPGGNGSAVTGYVITPSLNGVTQTAQSFDASAMTRTLGGLAAAGSYTFTVAASNAVGTSPASAPSAAVVPYSLPGAPTVSAASAGDSAAKLTWAAAASNGRAITGYVVTPYTGAVAQAPQTFTGAATTQTVTGLAAGTSYTFTVAAQNLAGTGPASPPSSTVIPNVSPSLTFTAPPAGEVGVAYSRLLAVTNGTSPFLWSVSSGALPAGLTLNASTGLLGGTPTASGTFPFTVQVLDASSQSATRSVTLVIAVAPTLTFTPPAGEVSVPYSHQPTLTGGTGPFSWMLTAGSLPAGVTLNPSTGLLSGTPTASGSNSATIAATGALGQTVSKAATLVIAALPAFSAGAPADGQVGVAYSTTLAVTGGTTPLTWSITAGSVPPGLTISTSTGVLSGTPTTKGNFPFTASVADSNSKTASKVVTLVIGAGPLVIIKTANVSSTVAGGTVAYTITITNTGSTTWTGATLSDPLTGVLDDANYAGNATATTGTLTYAAPALGWTGDITASGVVTINYSVIVNNPDVGNKVLSNTVTSPTLGTNCTIGTDPRCSSVVTVLVQALDVTKTVDANKVIAGDTVHYTISATNTGQADYPVVALTDSLAGVLNDAVYNADAATTTGILSYANGTLTWSGALPRATTVTITYSVTVTPTSTGNTALINRVVSTTVGNTCTVASVDPRCATITTIVARSITLTGITNSFTLTGQYNSTVHTDGAVTMTVTTNSTSGYLVTVQARTVSLTGAAPGNTETIPIKQLSVRDNGTLPFLPLSAAVSKVVHQKGTASVPVGDAIRNDYQVDIPFVPADTYSTTLDYIVIAQ
jgi:uncharacterized repeat protein (TIGR01451 family)